MASGHNSTMHPLQSSSYCKILLFAASLALFVPCPSFAATSSDDSEEAEPYDLSEFPQWTKDLRRLEIVSLGSVPFVMFTVTTTFSSYLYFSGESEQFINPFSRSSYSEGDQMKIFFLSLGTGAFIGLTDLTINIIKRRIERKKTMRIKAAEDQIIVVPFNDGRNRPPADASHPRTEGSPPRGGFGEGGSPPSDREPPEDGTATDSPPQIPQSTSD